MQKTRRTWFNGKDELLLICAICVIGFASAIPGYRLLDRYQYNSGKNLIGFFVPPILTIAYFTYTGFRYSLTSSALAKGLMIFLLLIIPYAPLMLQIFQPTPNDDFSRYYLYAQNMFVNHTLWGGDKLFFKDAGYHFVTQPGYRYWVYIELLVFRDLYRYVELINIAIYVITVFFFHKTIIRLVNSKSLLLCLLLLIFLFSPYIIKNSLMGLPEWFTIVLLMWFCFFYTKPRYEWLSVFLLGLVPFFRQNLVIFVLLLFGWIFLRSRAKLIILVVFIVPLLLPIYHNLYYAGEWRFFVDVFEVPYLAYSDSHEVIGLNYTLIGNNLLHYVGLDYNHGSLSFSLIALLFLPFACIIYFWLLKFLPATRNKILYVIITMSAIIPAILFGSAYYPRFESVNVAVMLASFVVLYYSRNEGLRWD